jgi:hypothetical protein
MAAQRCTDAPTVWTQLRDGKRECLWCEALQAIEAKRGKAALCAASTD